MRVDHRVPRLLSGLLLALPLLAAPLPAAGQCLNHTTATGVTSDLWTSLNPTDTGNLPDNRDSTNYNGSTRPDSRFPLFSSVETEGGYVFTTYSTGFQIWDARGAAAPQPVRVAEQDGWLGGFLHWASGNSEIRELVFDVDVPDGNSNLAAVAAWETIGLSIWNTTDKAHPVGVYHDAERTFLEVWTTTIGGRNYAFGAAIGTGAGLQIYDMTAALALGSCVEDTTVQVGCPGVRLGQLAAGEGVSFVDGFRHSSGKQYIAFASGGSPPGVALYDVSSPSSPVNLRSGGGRFLGGQATFGVALWQQGTKSYLAVHAIDGGRIYDITSCLAGGCAELPAPIWSQSWSVSAARLFVTFSRGGAGGTTPYLYFGSENMCSGGPQREWLFDVTDAASPVEEGVGKTKTVLNAFGQPVTINYWSYYYSGNPTGFSFVMPRRGKFAGNYFYRAAWTIFDIHQKVNVAPTITVSGPATAYTGDLATFTAQAFNCTPTAGSWSWTTDGGTGSSSTSSIDVEWATTGVKTVTATNPGCTAAEGSTTVTVLDPTPAVGSATASPSSAPICTPITFTANNVTGQPPLTFGWTVKQGTSPVDTGSGNPFTWDTSGATAGTYSGEVIVSGVGTSSPKSAPVTLTALPPLPTAGGWTPTNDPFTAATVQFHANLPGGTGATEWRWNFGDGSPVLETSDPAVGPNPTHVYTAVGMYAVSLEVRNCQTATWVRSATLNVDVTQITPLAIVSFQALCTFNPCSFNIGQAITFTQVVTGDPDFYDYDWDGNSNGDCASATGFEQTSASPVTTHTYSSVGVNLPVLRIRRGAESVCFTHAGSISITNPAPPPPPPTPSISVSGPTSGSTGVGYTFTASASNCTPATNGWSWSTSGGSGTSTSNSIRITWPTGGLKTVRASNSSCGTASGSRSISITGAGPTLAAVFTFSPASPAAGTSVSFDGGASTGNIGDYYWDFGDGVSGSGVTATHTYAVAGTYSASLTVSEPACVSPSCSASQSKTVTVTGTPLAARFTFTPQGPTVGDSVRFDASSSTGTIGSYSWAFGDGGTGTGVVANHIYTVPGTYTATLSILAPGCASPSCSAETSKTVEVAGPILGCTADDKTLCFLDGRFAVAVHYRVQGSGDTGMGKVMPFPSTDQSGAFSFFNPTNPELLVKVLDATDPNLFPNPAFWVFYGSLTNVEYWLEVTDTLGDADPENDVIKEYHNLPGTICGRLDTSAFPQTSLAPVTGGGPASARSALYGIPIGARGESAIAGGASGTCVPSSANLCLLDGRFSVEVSFYDQHNDQSGEGTAVEGNDQSGYFWFFNPNNLELVVKMVDATAPPFGYYWVFWGGTTDVEYTLRVTDTATSDTWETTNPPGSICGGSNTAAFPAP